MLKLYCFPRSGNSREVKLVLEEKTVPYEKVNVRDPGFDRESPEFKKASPKGKVPAIIDGDVYMAEAYDINVYLEGRYPQNPLLPADPKKCAEIREWVAVMDKRACLKIGLLLIECLLKPKPDQKEEVKEKLRREILEGLAELDRKLAGQEYFFGQFSLADVSITPHISGLRRVNFDIPEELKNLRAWFDRMKTRPSFAATQE